MKIVMTIVADVAAEKRVRRKDAKLAVATLRHDFQRRLRVAAQNEALVVNKLHLRDWDGDRP